MVENGGDESRDALQGPQKHCATRSEHADDHHHVQSTAPATKSVHRSKPVRSPVPATKSRLWTNKARGVHCACPKMRTAPQRERSLEEHPAPGAVDMHFEDPEVDECTVSSSELARRADENLRSKIQP